MNNSGSRPPARFLLAVVDAGGTVPPALNLAAELIRRGRDQRDNTIRVLRLGAGVRLSKKATSAQIATAISEILERPQYKAAAEELMNSQESPIWLQFVALC
jgi:DNA-binding NarL/FixJ family response regulator